jgi:hypothetical protein
MNWWIEFYLYMAVGTGILAYLWDYAETWRLCDSPSESNQFTWLAFAGIFISAALGLAWPITWIYRGNYLAHRRWGPKPMETCSEAARKAEHDAVRAETERVLTELEATLAKPRATVSPGKIQPLLEVTPRPPRRRKKGSAA